MALGHIGLLILASTSLLKFGFCQISPDETEQVMVRVPVGCLCGLSECPSPTTGTLKTLKVGFKSDDGRLKQELLEAKRQVVENTYQMNMSGDPEFYDIQQEELLSMRLTFGIRSGVSGVLSCSVVTTGKDSSKTSSYVTVMHVKDPFAAKYEKYEEAQPVTSTPQYATVVITLGIVIAISVFARYLVYRVGRPAL